MLFYIQLPLKLISYFRYLTRSWNFSSYPKLYPLFLDLNNERSRAWPSGYEIYIPLFLDLNNGGSSWYSSSALIYIPLFLGLNRGILFVFLATMWDLHSTIFRFEPAPFSFSVVTCKDLHSTIFRFELHRDSSFFLFTRFTFHYF